MGGKWDEYRPPSLKVYNFVIFSKNSQIISNHFKIKNGIQIAILHYISKTNENENYWNLKDI